MATPSRRNPWSIPRILPGGLRRSVISNPLGEPRITAPANHSLALSVPSAFSSDSGFLRISFSAFPALKCVFLLAGT